jgi:hypothetical protein
MTNRAIPSEDFDLCATCKGDTDGDDVVFHWGHALSADLIAITCSDACSEKFEQARALVDGEV